jgi:hypothetical protein
MAVSDYATVPRAYLAELEKDAARYRWLRAREAPYGTTWFYAIRLKTTQTLDEVFDAAMREGK